MTSTEAARRPSNAEADRAPPRDAFVVVGMHRSGTSALAGMLSFMGCRLPATPMAANRINERGYFESRAISDFDEEMLVSAGLSWSDWRPIPPGWIASPVAGGFRDRARTLLEEEYGDAPLLVLKDPRICRLLPFWLERLQEAGCAARIVHTHRDPMEVADSFLRLHAFDRRHGLLLWLRYVLDAEAATRGRPRLFVTYSGLMRNWTGVARAVVERHGVQLPRSLDGAGSDVSDFLSSDLRHSARSAEATLGDLSVPFWVRDVFAIMERWSDSGEVEGDHQALDAIRAAFDTAGEVCGPVALSDRRTAAELKAELAEMRTGLAAVERHRDVALARVEAAEASRAEREMGAARDLAAIEDRVVDLEAGTRRSAARITEISAERERAIARLRHQDRVIADRFREIAIMTGKLRAETRRREAAEADLETLRGSTFWRMTGPARRTVDRLRALRSR